MAKHVYVARRATGLNFVVIMEDAKGKETRRRVRFEKKQFQTDDDDLAAAIDATLDAYSNIARECYKTDKAAAEALARQHAALNQGGAVKGGVTAEAARSVMSTALHERDVQLRSQNADREAFADDGLVLSEEAPPAPVQPEATHEDVSKDAEHSNAPDTSEESGKSLLNIG